MPDSNLSNSTDSTRWLWHWWGGKIVGSHARTMIVETAYGAVALRALAESPRPLPPGVGTLSVKTAR